MNRAAVDPIADAVLYEGYILYPYRPSVKNRQRWTFGGLYPEAYCQAKGAGESSTQQTECLIQGTSATLFEAVVRFLSLTSRQVGELLGPLDDSNTGNTPPFRPVETLRIGDQILHTWQEAEEREVSFAETTLGDLVASPRAVRFMFPGKVRWEPVRGPDGATAGVLVRIQKGVEGTVDVSAIEAADGLFRLRLRVVNGTPMAGEEVTARDEALLCSLISTHSIVGVREGAFVSLMDPPDRWREAALGCRNIGAWPVLVGEEGEHDTMLASPIILYDYPQVAPESPGSFFDGTEIDEMLTLRIMTLTDQEKREMAAVDPRTAELLARTETMARGQLLGLHGTVRGLKPLPEEYSHG